MTTTDERRETGREIQGQLWPATRTGPTGTFPAAQLAPDFYDHVLQSAFGDVWSRDIQGWCSKNDAVLIETALVPFPVRKFRLSFEPQAA